MCVDERSLRLIAYVVLEGRLPEAILPRVTGVTVSHRCVSLPADMVYLKWVVAFPAMIQLSKKDPSIPIS
jgi:hypothetical protein